MLLKLFDPQCTVNVNTLHFTTIWSASGLLASSHFPLKDVKLRFKIN